VEADRQEQHQGQRDATRRGQSLPQPEQGAEADGELRDRDEEAERDREMGQRRDQRVDGAPPGRASQLRLDRPGITGLEEPGIGQLLKPGEAEREAEEGPQRKQCPAQHVRTQ